MNVWGYAFDRFPAPLLTKNTLGAEASAEELKTGSKVTVSERKGKTYIVDSLTYAVDGRVVIPGCATAGERPKAE